MLSYDYEMRDVVMDDPYAPMKNKTKSEELEPKLQSEWTKVEVKKVQVNFKAINTLHYVLNPTEFNRISTCKMIKKIWDKLKVTHEGTTQVKGLKIALISNQLGTVFRKMNWSRGCLKVFLRLGDRSLSPLLKLRV